MCICMCFLLAQQQQQNMFQNKTTQGRNAKKHTVKVKTHKVSPTCFRSSS
ncbi:hypothetical protein Hanom_Chr09g00861801 [Helianthus anomalus]